MSKSAVNFLVDAVALAAIMLLGATGILIRYVLPPGSGHFSQLWGRDRHQWGQIHFWIAVVLLCTVVLHLFLHWQWIVSTVRGRPGSRSAMRIGLAIAGILLVAGVMVAPFFGQVNRPASRHTRCSPKSARRTRSTAQ